MTKYLLLLLPTVGAWMDRQSFPRNTLIKPVTRTVLFQGDKEVASVDENPCWQDFYDEDCSMDSTFEAGFVPSEWLKKMPCASGLEDCDMPEDLKLPGNRKEAGVEEVDVLQFLNLKRAGGVHSTGEQDGVTP